MHIKPSQPLPSGHSDSLTARKYPKILVTIAPIMCYIIPSGRHRAFRRREHIMTTKGNARQNAVLNDIIDYLTMKSGSRHSYEVKSLKVTDSADWDDIYVSLTVGIRDDEGTMAELLCRDNYGFFIGPRGGIFYYGKRHGMNRISKHELYKIRW